MSQYTTVRNVKLGPSPTTSLIQGLHTYALLAWQRRFQGEPSLLMVLVSNEIGQKGPGLLVIIGNVSRDQISCSVWYSEYPLMARPNHQIKSNQIKFISIIKKHTKIQIYKTKQNYGGVLAGKPIRPEKAYTYYIDKL